MAKQNSNHRAQMYGALWQYIRESMTALENTHALALMDAMDTISGFSHESKCYDIWDCVVQPPDHIENPKNYMLRIAEKVPPRNRANICQKFERIERKLEG